MNKFPLGQSRTGSTALVSEKAEARVHILKAVLNTLNICTTPANHSPDCCPWGNSQHQLQSAGFVAVQKQKSCEAMLWQRAFKRWWAEVQSGVTHGACYRLLCSYKSVQLSDAIVFILHLGSALSISFFLFFG